MAKSKSDVLDAALAILDEYGLPDLTMRRLADALDVKPGAIYWHYASKQSLLAGIADEILAEVPPPVDGAWRTAADAWVTGLRHTLLRHRDSADVVMTARAMGLGAAQITTPLIVVFVRAGLSGDAAAVAADAVVHFALGHVFHEQNRDQWQRLGWDLAAGSHDVDASTFAGGMGLLLDGVAAQRPDSDGPQHAHA